MRHVDKDRNKFIKIIAIIIPLILAIVIGGVITIYLGGKDGKNNRDLLSLSVNSGIKVFDTAINAEVSEHIVVRPTQIGEQFATLMIPSLNFSKPVYEGDSNEVLAMGIGHYEGSTVPGENGNVLLCGHRDIDQGLRELQDIKEGDEVVMKMSYGDYYYRVSEIKIVDPNNTDIGNLSEHEKLTMYTCYPFDYIGSAPNRYVVICDFVKVK